MDYWQSQSIGSWFFLRGLGVVYAVAFVSLWGQLAGLFSSRGIRPIREFLEHWDNLKTKERLTSFPTLFWFGANDRILHATCAMGLALSIAVIVDFATGPCLLGLWILYLSYVTVGQEFLSFQWDALLLETGLAAMLLAPWPSVPAASPLACLLIAWILFRLLFESGVVKLTSGDETWRNLTALDYHHFTQPLPTRFAWYLYQLPARFQRLSVALVFLLELGPPVLIWGPSPVRFAAFGFIVALQIAIAVSGNYGFFNWLTLVLAFPLVDDSIWRSVLPASFLPTPALAIWTSPRLLIEVPAVLVILLITIPQIRRCLNPIHRGAIWIRKIERALRPFFVANPYGLFRVMTTKRYELLVEGSLDGDEWKPYRFRFKPDDIGVAPKWSQPHLPRLDWQRWFAALGDLDSNPWLESFLTRLLDNEPAVVRLLADNPFADEAPRYLRIIQSDFEFTTIAERKLTGNWWKSKALGLYCPVVYGGDE